MARGGGDLSSLLLEGRRSPGRGFLIRRVAPPSPPVPQMLSSIKVHRRSSQLLTRRDFQPIAASYYYLEAEDS